MAKSPGGHQRIWRCGEEEAAGPDGSGDEEQAQHARRMIDGYQNDAWCIGTFNYISEAPNGINLELDQQGLSYITSRTLIRNLTCFRIGLGRASLDIKPALKRSGLQAHAAAELHVKPRVTRRPSNSLHSCNMQAQMAETF